MALRLIENKNINGIKVKIDDIAHIIKISQLADDTTLFVSSKTDIDFAMNEIEIYGYFYV
jgi:dihydrodipicolinate synthase/N-acetylneuraminate lyase